MQECVTLSEKYLKNKRAGGMAEVVESLLAKRRP
jgi:hypothetical protein